MRINSFEEIVAWQKSRELNVLVYDLFKESRDYGFRDQIQRASVSISNNIAEGFERQSNKDFRKFLYIAKGSCGEVRSMMYLALDLNYVREPDFNLISAKTTEISKIIAGFIKTL